MRLEKLIVATFVIVSDVCDDPQIVIQRSNDRIALPSKQGYLFDAAGLGYGNMTADLE